MHDISTEFGVGWVRTVSGRHGYGYRDGISERAMYFRPSSVALARDEDELYVAGEIVWIIQAHKLSVRVEISGGRAATSMNASLLPS